MNQNIIFDTIEREILYASGKHNCEKKIDTENV